MLIKQKISPESPWHVSFPVPSPAHTCLVESIKGLYILFVQALSVSIGRSTCINTSERLPSYDKAPLLN